MPSLSSSVRKTGPSRFEFGREYIEIAVLDQKGVAVWRSRKSTHRDIICWTGVDDQGRPVGVGSYIFKLLGLNGETAYVPFILG